MAKEWLESTTRFDVPWVGWDDPSNQFVQVPQIDGSPKRLDIAGWHYDDKMNGQAEFFGEVKNYKSEGKLVSQYESFLVTCYSAMHTWRGINDERPREFLFITWHPFGPVSNYTKLTTVDWIKRSVDANPLRVPPDKWDGNLAAALAARLWLLIPSRQLPKMQMSRDHLGVVKNHVTRKGVPSA